MNIKMLKSIMVLNGETGKTMADYIGISEATFSTKMNKYRGAEFTQSEIQLMKDKFDLNAYDVDAIFFDKEVS